MGAILNAPVIVDIGKTSRSNIKDLKQGRGKLLVEVREAMDEVSASLGADADGKHLIPVVLVYKQKDRTKNGKVCLPSLRLPVLG